MLKHPKEKANPKRYISNIKLLFSFVEHFYFYLVVLLIDVYPYYFICCLFRYMNLVNGIQKMNKDGLNSIRYDVYSFKNLPTYTWYLTELKFRDQNT